MTRRMFLWMLAAAGFVLRGGSTLSAQDVRYARPMDRAQKDRPSTLGAIARTAPASEPGDPVIVRDRLRNLDGASAAGAIVFAYHTDRGGLYDDSSKGPHSWRLRGWARTEADGRFTFGSIRPARIPAAASRRMSTSRRSCRTEIGTTRRRSLYPQPVAAMRAARKRSRPN